MHISASTDYVKSELFKAETIAEGQLLLGQGPSNYSDNPLIARSTYTPYTVNPGMSLYQPLKTFRAFCTL